MNFEIVKIIYDLNPFLLDTLDIYEKVTDSSYKLFMRNIKFVCYHKTDTYVVQAVVEGEVITEMTYADVESASLAFKRIVLSTLKSLLGKLKEKLS